MFESDFDFRPNKNDFNPSKVIPKYTPKKYTLEEKWDISLVLRVMLDLLKSEFAMTKMKKHF